MKKYRLMLAFACALSTASYGWGQIAVSNTGALAFGKFVAGSGGAVSIDTNGVRTRSGGVQLLTSGAGTAATFNVTDTDPANANKTYIITLPDNDTLVLASDGNSMALNDFVSNPSGSSVLTAGAQGLNVGATLSVSPNQPVGNYTGNFSVIVNYQ